MGKNALKMRFYFRLLASKLKPKKITFLGIVIHPHKAEINLHITQYRKMLTKFLKRISIPIIENFVVKALLFPQRIQRPKIQR